MKATPSDKSIAIRRKRGHYNTACSVCHKRKTKCDGIKPTCQPCRRSGRESQCMWVRPNTKIDSNQLEGINVNRIEGISHPEEEKIPEVHKEKYISIHHNNDHVSQ